MPARADVRLFGFLSVGKSTLTNALIGTDAITTQAIREDDAKDGERWSKDRFFGKMVRKTMKDSKTRR